MKARQPTSYCGAEQASFAQPQSGRDFVRRASCGARRRWLLLGLLVFAPLAETGAAEPSTASYVGESVTNPVTSTTTTVSRLILDPAGTPSAGATSFVETADGYVFLVKAVGEVFYNSGTPTVSFTIVSKDAGAKTVTVRSTAGADPTETLVVAYQLTKADYDTNYGSKTKIPGTTPVPVIDGGAAGRRIVYAGQDGDSGWDGFFFVPPGDGDNGSAGPNVAPFTNTLAITANNTIGLEFASIGGNGGTGGDSIFSWWSGGDGGHGGSGGSVQVANRAAIQVTATSFGMHGLYAYSLSGKAGNGGDAKLAPEGGDAGNSCDGGQVTVGNYDVISTDGPGSYGIFALSVSNNGGSGGNQWGLGGRSGAGGQGSDGGSVSVLNGATGRIYTADAYSHGILAQSVGGSGGSSGSSGNLLFSLAADGGRGGDGGLVGVTNLGFIQTLGDDSRGIFAQSLGGGGGSGGSTGGLVALGGAGANGGSGKAVTVRNESNGTPNTGTIITAGARSDGIFAQSVGGSGGNGSDAGGLVALGGNGSYAGGGDEVQVVNLGTIATRGAFARGIVAQSIGGGGGDGGSTGAMVSVGGRGGAGGNGGIVKVTNGGLIATAGDDATGIFAQSVGGGGGNGGSTVSVSLFAGASIGGKAGDGGFGGNVDITLQGSSADQRSSIITGAAIEDADGNPIPQAGDRAFGVFAQSVGGGGGTGGGAVQVTVGFDAAAALAIGGQGGKGGYGGVVTMSAGEGQSDVTTHGDDATGVFLQSVGGGGGTGGYAVAVAASAGDSAVSVSTAIGGQGGLGGYGGLVKVGTFDPTTKAATCYGFDGDITTEGERAGGLVAQSVGGGGGNGGLAVSTAVGGSLIGGVSVAVGFGGTGAPGGAGGDVAVATRGNITTSGINSTGFLAQSVGGGGGNGGGSITAGIAGSGGVAGSISVGVGGKAGAASNGGKVMAETGEGVVTTTGANATGIIVQSIGGSGGNGGYSIAAGAAGAGALAASVNVGLGGTGGAGGAGEEVTAVLRSAVHTYGAQVKGRAVDPSDEEAVVGNSGGVLVQSVGGGGGNGGFSIAAGAAGAGTGSGEVSVGLGGKGGAGGIGKTVHATTTNTITTEGDRSTGFVAQSIGGSGGSGGFAITAGATGAGTGSGAVNVGLGGTGGTGADGGAVVANTSGDIETFGNMSGGILAQSVGGGGGNGGFAVTVSGSGGGTGSAAVTVGLGGDGAGGGDGLTVGLTVTNDVITRGDSSSGIVAQSVGGGGGNGGFAVTVSGSGAGTGSAAVAVGLGGGAGNGGNAEAVTANVTGNITTGLVDPDPVSGVVDPLAGGDNSIGLLVQSVGGGGGNGGFNVTAAISGAGKGSVGAAVGLGGSGGDGGNASTVNSTFVGDVNTNGVGAGGIVAQSVGGGGGNGGLSVTGAISAAKSGSAAAAVSIGGSGGKGGYAEGVVNSVTGNVATRKANSGGVLAQSVGGGGGNGGISVSGSVSLASTGAAAVGVGIGGSGGDGGYAKQVTNTVTGTVLTAGDDSMGVTAQSLGGGGGNGGLNVTGTIAASREYAGAVGIGIGGSGGLGGDAELVTNTVTGYVQTSGKNSIGILAQSEGGGGGNGALNVTGVITASNKSAGNLGVGVGGFGGDGGLGRAVINTVTGGVLTTGENSIGILAQSLGGGGGNGGVNVTGTVNLTKENGGTLGVGIGGFGGGGKDSGTVTSTVATTPEHATIVTEGDHSSAIVAQSIGGSGGNGGLNVTQSLNLLAKNGAAIGVGIGGFGGGAGNADVVTLDVTGTVATYGRDSDGLFAQSIGGGGGNGGTNIAGALNFSKSESGGTAVAASIGVGGFGGGGGNAGSVDLTYQGTLLVDPREWIPQAVDAETGLVVPAHYGVVAGAGSNGIVAQAVGGGGGNGGLNVSTGVSYALGKDSGGHALVVGVGGFGGGGGAGGIVDVTVNTGSVISAFGDDSHAILAQSVGGGGGNGGINISGGLTSDAPIVVGVGGFGGTAGIAKAVTVDATADLYSSGKNAAGLLAQSLGGAGGNGGLNVSGALSLSNDSNVPSITFGIGGFGGAGAISDDVTVTQRGTIATSGDWSHGIFAQSVAGGGGNGALNIAGSFDRENPKADDNKSKFAVVVGLGGHGGVGANAADAKVTSSGAITTTGDYARGIFAQSLGGGGGTGGMNISGVVGKDESPVVLGIGGFGGGGGNAGAATVIRGSDDEAAGLITTDGLGAYGIEATSIGGGGGDAGANFLLAVALDGSSGGNSGGDTPKKREHPKHTGVDPAVFTKFDKVLDELESRQKSDAKPAPADKKKSYAVQIAIGGAGGTAGDGGAAEVENHGDITTLQDRSHAILAQSIGGGGGNASLNVAFAYTGQNDESKGLNFMLGGATGDGGDGAGITVVHDGAIDTLGTRSYGILAQSIGGGGGDAGLDYSNTWGKGNTYDIKIGRKGGSGGIGGEVRVESAGSVVTRGDDSHAILAQSVGNGGGTSSTTSISGSLGSASDKKDDDVEFDIEVGIDGGVGGRASRVDVEVSGLIWTEGDRANGIFAQSVGGGGGEAGGAGGFETLASSLTLMVGGTGGTGGTGGAVGVTTSAEIVTHGEASIGVLAQSVGGGGGDGGSIMAIGKRAENGSFMLGVGGSGGSASEGGAVTVANSGRIRTDGSDAYGVLAQSVGGGGGTAGSIIRDLINTEAKGDMALDFLLGAQGGDGGISRLVDVTNTGWVVTEGERAIGVFAQSVGGGGGAGSYVISNSISTKGGGNKLNIAVGGNGGVGGKGGEVRVANGVAGGAEDSGVIVTRGDAAHGIFAMSVGGGGGNGGASISSTTAARPGEKAASNAFAFSLGGDGGEGGTGAAVTVTNAGWIETYGAGAHGIVAQSVGGGGGNGGLGLAGNLVLGSTTAGDVPQSAFTVGGFGGEGESAGTVTVNNSGTIFAHGDRSYGVFAQSVGGGGGNGGFAAALSGDLRANPATTVAPEQISIAIGGRGGSGGDGGDVLVNHTGAIQTDGDNSYGVFAQSVSGGGGTVGASISHPAWMAAELALDLALGFSGSSGQPGTVKVITEGSIVTTGANSHGVFTQQVNGGGGDLNVFLDVSQKATALIPDNEDGAAATNALALGARARVKTTLSLGVGDVFDAISGQIESVHRGDLSSLGVGSLLDAVQGIGGGGGNGRLEFVVDDEASVEIDAELGGSDVTNSDGGAIDVTRTGQFVTLGARSMGTGVQSIGGGGGMVDLSVRTVAPSAPVQAPASAAMAASGPMLLAAEAEPAASVATVSLGANGGAGNDGGAVALESHGERATAGERSPALLVQSIGAGGGSALVTGLGTVSVVLGGTGGASGHGGTISITNTGTVQTAGALSHGLVLQSIGGGGGLVLTDLDASALTLTRNADNSGDGGAIHLSQAGDIVVRGEGAIGVVAQSLGGGGGMVDRLFADTAGGAGSSGAVSLVLDGNVVADGAGGVGLFVQSRGRDGQGDIEVSLAAGKSVLAGAGGVALWLSGGAENHLVARGAVGTADGIDGTAILATDGNDRIENFGTLVGCVDLGSGTDELVNREGALFVPGASVHLGTTGNLLTNHGTVSPGDGGLAQRVDLAGSFRQTATGTTLADLDCSTGTVDHLAATGSVDLTGSLRLTLGNTPLIRPGRFAPLLFSGDAGLTNNGLALVTAPSAVVRYQLATTTPGALALDYAVTFSPEGMDANLGRLGDYINRLQDAGSAPELADTIARLVALPDLPNYRAALVQLAPDFYGEHQAWLYRSNARFAESMASHLATASIDRQGGAFWAEQGVDSDLHFGRGDYQAAHRSTRRTTVGLVKAGAHWRAGLAMLAEQGRSTGFGGRWTADDDINQAGLSFTYDWAGWEVATHASYGRSETRARRWVEIAAPYQTTAERDLEILGATVRVSRDFSLAAGRQDRFQLRPALEVGAAHLSAETSTESAAGSDVLKLWAQGETRSWATLRLEGSYIHSFGDGFRLQPYVDLEFQRYLSPAETWVRAGFDVAPAGVAPMMVPIDLGKETRSVGAGIAFATPRGVIINAGYRNLSAVRTHVNSANLSLIFRF